MKELFTSYKTLRKRSGASNLRILMEFCGIVLLILFFLPTIILILRNSNRHREPWEESPERYDKVISIHRGIFFDTKTEIYIER